MIGASALGLLFAAASVAALTESKSLAEPDPLGEREKLSIAELSSHDEQTVEPLHFDNFRPIGSEIAEAEAMEGILTVSTFPLSGHYAGEPQRSVSETIPGFSFAVITFAEVFLPLKSDRILRTESGSWNIILSPGRTWSEPADEGWSRVAFPFTLVRRIRGGVANGVAMFAHKDDVVSDLRVQIGQEGEPDHAKINYWGQSGIEYTPQDTPGRDQAIECYEIQHASDFPNRFWQDLEALSKVLLIGFDNDYIRHYLSVSGLLLDGVVYRSDCHTRFGPQPFCDRLRHPVYSVSKSLGAAIAMLRLAEKYGPEVFDERILDHVPLTPEHDGWQDVTFGDAPNMATGIGNIAPGSVSRVMSMPTLHRSRCEFGWPPRSTRKPN